LWSWVEGHYSRLLAWSLDNRGLVMGIAAGTFLLTFPLNALVGRDWIPPDDQSELTVLLNLPEGTSLEGTSRLATDLSNRIAKLPEVEFTNPYIHEGLASHSHLYVKLKDISERKKSNLEVAADVRKMTTSYPNLRTRVMI